MKDSEIFYTSVAGINYRCTPEDVGPILGYVEQDKNNSYNPKAVGVYKLNGDLLGYISEKNLDDFYEFKGEGFEKLIYSGNIKKVIKSDKDFYVGNIAIIKSEDEKELTELVNKLLFDNFNLYGKNTPEK